MNYIAIQDGDNHVAIRNEKGAFIISVYVGGKIISTPQMSGDMMFVASTDGSAKQILYFQAPHFALKRTQPMS